MKLSASEKVTLNFYKWEYLGRGYYHFDDAVAIEPPFTPFVHRSFTDETYIDDGHTPSLFKRIKNLVISEKTTAIEKNFIEEETITPNFLLPTKQLVGFSFTFPKNQEITSLISAEFLNMLVFSNDAISFEIHGTHKNIAFQIVSSIDDKIRIQSHLKGYFPSVILKDIEVHNLHFDTSKSIAIADFGLHSEFMRPIQTSANFNIDPLTSIIATLDNLQFGDTALIQILFQGAIAPWSRSILNAVSDGIGGSFFPNAPEMLPCAEEKVSKPLFSCVFRIASQGINKARSQYIATELCRSVTTVSTSKYNKFIALTNEGYGYENHLQNVYQRTSNRLGMLLNTDELTTFIHYPNKTVVSSKLGYTGGKTKKPPANAISKKYIIGNNIHNENDHKVTIDDQARLKHTHIIGATGVGKSTLIANMLIQDMNAGNGSALFDPHGDIVEDILMRIPEHRKKDVIIIDPSDTQFPIGFNLLGANTEAEKIVLSSDLVAAFKRHATAWGDNMTAVLSNAINTFLESSRKGTLIELKRFLLEDQFREEFLNSVEDPSIHYYWQHEYYMVKKRIAPLLTRIDTFLRPKIIRSMLAQNQGVDFKKCIEQKKIVLIKLSQGLIGEENSYLLGSLFLSKFNQVARSRQSISKEKRHPYYIYLDEFQNFITPSIVSILSGARKYGLGLILAHQELGQIEESKILNSVISNSHTRICFRLGDNDAKKLEQGFSYFEQTDLQSLGVGQAIMRLGSANSDFNISTNPLPKIDITIAKNNRNTIIQNTRETYAKPKLEIDELLKSLLPSIKVKKSPIKKNSSIEEIPFEKPSTQLIEEVRTIKDTNEAAINIHSKTSLELHKEAFIAQENVKVQQRKHLDLQNFVKKVAQQRNFKVTLEEQTENGGRADVGLLKDKTKIAIEISVRNTIDYEVKNIEKCIASGYDYVYMISENIVHLNNIEKRAKEKIKKPKLKKVSFFTPLSLAQQLDNLLKDNSPKTAVKRVRGYRVTTNYEANTSPKNPISEILIKTIQKNK